MTLKIQISIIGLSVFAASCTGTKGSRAVPPGNSTASHAKVVNKNPKFLDDISIDPASPSAATGSTRENTKKNTSRNDYPYPPSSAGNNALQMKYALLLNTQVEEINNLPLFRFIDEWYGTRYCLGGTSKSCIDCSGFVQTFFSSLYGIRIPRTAKDQYAAAGKISSRKLKEGDLLFFNTRGGVSHVGIYLQNNRFVHASTNSGVVISDLSEPYYAKRFIGAGRMENNNEMTGR